MSDSKAGVIARVCAAQGDGAIAEARHIARAEYPFDPSIHAGRKYTEYQSLQIFWRDGFVDQYSGNLLVFPGTLRLLSWLLPEEFPAHPTGRWRKATLSTGNCFQRSTTLLLSLAAERILQTIGCAHPCFETARRATGRLRSSGGGATNRAIRINGTA